MYANHVPYLAREIHAHPSTLKRAVIFAALSARVQFHRVPEQMDDVDRNGGESGALWNWKHGTYLHMEQFSHDTHLQLLQADRDLEKALHVITRVPGMGLIKGAFVLQMMGYDVACIDTRNATRLGTHIERFQTHGRPVTDRLMRKYLDVAGGHAQEYWDAWCEEVGNDTMRRSEDVSEAHLDCVIPSWRALRPPTTQWLCPIYPYTHIPF